MKRWLLFGLALVALSLVARAQENWTPEFCMQFKSLSGTAISPTGDYVAYVVREPRMEGEESAYLEHIWLARTDGSANYQYTRGDKSCFAPAFSPDGEYLAFLSSRSGKTQLHLMRVMGGESEQITELETGVGSFQWSPDGKRLAFLSRDPETAEEKQARKEKRDVILVDQNFKYDHLYTVTVFPEAGEERRVQRLTRGDFHVTAFDWSPDGTTIAFSHKADPRINTSRIDSDISLVSSDSSGLTTLVNRPGPDENPVFSPDGRYVAFTSDGGKMEPVGLSDIYVVPVTGGELVALPHTPDRNAGILGWSADGRDLFVAEAGRTKRVALKLPVGPALEGKDDKGRATVVGTDEGAAASWDLLPAKGKMAFVHQTLDRPAELFFGNIAGKDFRQLSRVNSAVELPEMGRSEVIRWKSKDGLEIEGILTYPQGYKEGEKVPLVLQIHGGPGGVFSETFTGNPSIYMTQYFAEQGYAVLRPNPRGSTGYGKEFRYANFKDWGFGDYEDVMSGVDKVIDMGVADENKMAVMGWSYGGYLTSFLVTRTNRFKVASMGAGLPNLISMTTTTDIPDYLVAHMGGEFWDDYETYEKHSAMYRIKEVETPTQVIHGANDLRVPFTQGQEFYVALQRRGIPTEMIVLPRTPHGPREPKLLMEVSPRILKWFERFLNPEPKP